MQQIPLFPMIGTSSDPKGAVEPRAFAGEKSSAVAFKQALSRASDAPEYAASQAGSDSSSNMPAFGSSTPNETAQVTSSPDQGTQNRAMSGASPTTSNGQSLPLQAQSLENSEQSLPPASLFVDGGERADENSAQPLLTGILESQRQTNAAFARQNNTPDAVRNGIAGQVGEQGEYRATASTLTTSSAINSTLTNSSKSTAQTASGQPSDQPSLAVYKSSISGLAIESGQSAGVVEASGKAASTSASVTQTLGALSSPIPAGEQTLHSVSHPASNVAPSVLSDGTLDLSVNGVNQQSAVATQSQIGSVSPASNSDSNALNAMTVSHASINATESDLAVQTGVKDSALSMHSGQNGSAQVMAKRNAETATTVNPAQIGSVKQQTQQASLRSENAKTTQADVISTGPSGDLESSLSQLNGSKGMQPEAEARFKAVMDQLQGGNRAELSADLGDTSSPKNDLASIGKTADAKAPELSNLQQASNRPYVSSLGIPIDDSQWASQLGQKLMWMSARNIQSAELHLNPADLGPIEVRIQLGSDQSSINFNTQNQTVRELLEANIHRLREMLSGQQEDQGSQDGTLGDQRQSLAQQQSLDAQSDGSQHGAAERDEGLISFGSRDANPSSSNNDDPEHSATNSIAATQGLNQHARVDAYV